MLIFRDMFEARVHVNFWHFLDLPIAVRENFVKNKDCLMTNTRDSSRSISHPLFSVIHLGEFCASFRPADIGRCNLRLWFG
jgi:hypothetical protein